VQQQVAHKHPVEFPLLALQSVALLFQSAALLFQSITFESLLFQLFALQPLLFQPLTFQSLAFQRFLGLAFPATALLVEARTERLPPHAHDQPGHPLLRQDTANLC
jgi:hypothetical protein